jgi:cyclophilin family peptidyl-prolyl cis-trans isomerase
MSIRNTRPDPRRVRRQRPLRSARSNSKLSNDSVPTALRFLTHRYVFIGFGVIFAAGIVLGVFAGILGGGSQVGTGPMQANEAADVPRDATGATVTPSANSQASLTPTATIKRYATAPAVTIDPSRKYQATIETTQGNITIELDPSVSLDAVNAFIFLAGEKYYDGTPFMQVNPEAPKFTAQAGDPTRTGLGTPGFSVNERPTQKPFVRGAVGYDSGQFYISYQDEPALNGKETIIGNVTSGLDVLDKLNLLNVKQTGGTTADSIKSITVTPL